MPGAGSQDLGSGWAENTDTRNMHWNECEISNLNVQLVFEMVRTGLEALIVGSEADIHITALNGRSPLVCAAACGQLACIEMLLTHGAEAGGFDGCLALVAAARKGRNKCVEALLLSGAEVDALEDRKCSPKGECVAARGSSHSSSYISTRG